MSKKEMGLAVRAIVQYASDCSGNGDYGLMKQAFDIAIDITAMYELKEKEWIRNISVIYIKEALNELETTITEGRRAQEIYNELLND